MRECGEHQGSLTLFGRRIFKRSHAIARELIDFFIFGMARMAFDPMKFDSMAFDDIIKSLPEVGIFHGLFIGCFPAIEIGRASCRERV